MSRDIIAKHVGQINAEVFSDVIEHVEPEQIRQTESLIHYLIELQCILPNIHPRNKLSPEISQQLVTTAIRNNDSALLMKAIAVHSSNQGECRIPIDISGNNVFEIMADIFNVDYRYDHILANAILKALPLESYHTEVTSDKYTLKVSMNLNSRKHLIMASLPFRYKSKGYIYPENEVSIGDILGLCYDKFYELLRSDEFSDYVTLSEEGVLTVESEVLQSVPESLSFVDLVDAMYPNIFSKPLVREWYHELSQSRRPQVYYSHVIGSNTPSEHWSRLHLCTGLAELVRQSSEKEMDIKSIKKNLSVAFIISCFWRETEFMSLRIPITDTIRTAKERTRKRFGEQ